MHLKGRFHYNCYIAVLFPFLCMRHILAICQFLGISCDAHITSICAWISSHNFLSHYLISYALMSSPGDLLLFAFFHLLLGVPFALQVLDILLFPLSPQQPYYEFHKTTASIFPLAIGHSQLNYYPFLNPFEHTAVCETGWAMEAFAVNSSFLSVDGMTCPILFESWRNDLSNGI